MKRIGEYEVLGLLGKGGMSKVFKVRRAAADEIHALKLMSPHPHLVGLLGVGEIRKRFEAEARVMAEMKSPHVVEVLDSGQHDGQPFIVMEYCCHNLGLLIGETYRLERPARALRVDKAIRFAQQILLGLSHLHENGIVHRDIKPFNVLLTDDETVRLTDFGLSKVRGEMLSGPRQMVVGSPYYAAPEQEEHPDKVDPRADLYSVGVVLYRMLTGRLPMDEPVPPSSHNPELDGEWDGFLMKALDRDRNARQSSALEMHSEIDVLETRWEERMARVCGHWEPVSPASKHEMIPRFRLRATPVKASPSDAAVRFGVDELWRPKRFVPNDFADDGDGAVRDRTTGLIWDKKGSIGKMTWPDAHRYVATLNDHRLAEKNGWRLPTIEELMSLLIPVPHQDDYCMEPLFGRDRKWLWSVDRRSFSAAWYVSADVGYVSWQDFTCRFFVRAVLTEP
jgi:serine/threonine-protein kinase